MASTDEPANSDESPKPEKEAEVKAPVSNYFRILSYGTPADWIMMGIASCCAVGAGVTLPLMNIVFGALVSDFNKFFTPGPGVTKDEFMDGVTKNVLYIIYLFIGKFVLGYISMFCLRMTGTRISANLRLAYLRALFNRPLSFIDELPVGRPTETITTSSNLVQAGISDKIAMFLQSLALIIAAYGVAFSRSWALTLACSSTLVFMLLVFGISIPFYIKILGKIDTANGKATSIAGEVLASIRTIVACGAEERVSAQHAKWMTEAKTRGLRTSPVIGLQFGTSQFATFCNFALAFWFGVRLFIKGQVEDVGPVITVIFSMLIVVSAFSFITSPLMVMSKAVSASANFFSVLDSPSLKTSGLKDISISDFDDLGFRDVTFSYPRRPNVKILDDISLKFPVGKVTALVGPSGCGKSTIVALLERWYQISDQTENTNNDNLTEKGSPSQASPQGPEVPTPNSGAIQIGPHNIEDFDLKWWRSQIGFVQQEPFSFSTSIFNNVAFGLVGSKWENESEDVKRQLVKEACREAFADEFIDKLPEGYDTTIGEGGIKLSGGQRQRLAIARSIIKQPPLLILDEATSSIDVRGERVVQAALDRVSRNRTTITIAHRLSTIKKADNIIVLQKGKAIEQGTHEELLSRESLYQTLVENQQLEMGDGDEVPIEDMPKDTVETVLSRTKTGSTIQQDAVEMPPKAAAVQKSRSLANSVGLFLWEQRKYWIMYAALVVGAAGCGSAFSLQSFLFAKLTSAFQLTGNELKKESEFFALMFLILAIGSSIFYMILGWACVSLAAYISAIYRQEYFENIIRKPISFFDQEGNSAGSLTSNLSSDPTKLQELLGPTMAFPMISLFNIFGCIAISFAFGWKLTLVSIFSAFPVIIGAMFVRVRYEVKFDQLNAAVFAESSQFASEAIGAFRTVASLTLEDTITGRYSTLLGDHVKSAFRKARLGALVISLSDSIEFLCMALCFWYGGTLLSTHEYNVDQFMVIYIAIILGGQAAGQFGSVTPNMAQATVAANRIIDHRPKEETNPDETAMPRPEGGVEIEFKSVKFKYPTRDMWVYKDLSFTIAKGQFVALVGPSGCGKTTVIALLEKFYDYQGGSIEIDGVELKSLEAKSYRKNLSLVPQEPTLYQGSILDNVLLGVEPSSVNRADAERACKDAEIHDFIQSLPQGYDTDVGQRGLTLSGGQKQRICIARALIRDPRLLLLDEATSSLDSESEKLVQSSIERTAKGRTVVAVAHRLATIQNADVIFVFSDGGIVESGNHHSLLKKRGAYYQMCESQALDR